MSEAHAPSAPAPPLPPDAQPRGPAAPEPVPALREGMVFEGLLVLPRPARIDGRVRGEVLAGDAVWVGPTGVVEADLEADSVVVEGRVEGDLRARHAIALGAAAVVSGDLSAPSLRMEEGARVYGRCRCGPVADPEAARGPATVDPAA